MARVLSVLKWILLLSTLGVSIYFVYLLVNVLMFTFGVPGTIWEALLLPIIGAMLLAQILGSLITWGVVLLILIIATVIVWRRDARTPKQRARRIRK